MDEVLNDPRVVPLPTIELVPLRLPQWTRKSKIPGLSARAIAAAPVHSAPKSAGYDESESYSTHQKSKEYVAIITGIPARVGQREIQDSLRTSGLDGVLRVSVSPARGAPTHSAARVVLGGEAARARLLQLTVLRDAAGRQFSVKALADDSGALFAALSEDRRAGAQDGDNSSEEPEVPHPDRDSSDGQPPRKRGKGRWDEDGHNDTYRAPKRSKHEPLQRKIVDERARLQAGPASYMQIRGVENPKEEERSRDELVVTEIRQRIMKDMMTQAEDFFRKKIQFFIADFVTKGFSQPPVAPHQQHEAPDERRTDAIVAPVKAEQPEADVPFSRINNDKEMDRVNPFWDELDDDIEDDIFAEDTQNGGKIQALMRRIAKKKRLAAGNKDNANSKAEIDVSDDSVAEEKQRKKAGNVLSVLKELPTVRTTENARLFVPSYEHYKCRNPVYSTPQFSKSAAGCWKANPPSLAEALRCKEEHRNACRHSDKDYTAGSPSIPVELREGMFDALLCFIGSKGKVSKPLGQSIKTVIVAKSRIHNMGLFTLEGTKVGEPVIEYVGERITPKLSDEREEKYKSMGMHSTYFFTVESGDTERVIDATWGGNLARFANHSCDPNCVVLLKKSEGMSCAVLSAIKPIAPFGEILINYNMEAEVPIPCSCGTKPCSGFMANEIKQKNTTEEATNEAATEPFQVDDGKSYADSSSGREEFRRRAASSPPGLAAPVVVAVPHHAHKGRRPRTRDTGKAAKAVADQPGPDRPAARVRKDKKEKKDKKDKKEKKDKKDKKEKKEKKDKKDKKEK